MSLFSAWSLVWLLSTAIPCHVILSLRPQSEEPRTLEESVFLLDKVKWEWNTGTELLMGTGEIYLYVFI